MVTAFTSGLVGLWFNPRPSHTLDFKKGNLAAFLPNAGQYRNSARTGWPVSVYCDVGKGAFVCDCVAAHNSV